MYTSLLFVFYEKIYASQKEEEGWISKQKNESQKICGDEPSRAEAWGNWPTHGLKFLIFSLPASAWVRQWIRIQNAFNLIKDICHCSIIFEHSLIFFYVSDFVVTSFLNLYTGITFVSIIYLYICALEDI